MEGATLQLSSALISQAYIHRLSQDEQLGEGFSFFFRSAPFGLREPGQWRESLWILIGLLRRLDCVQWELMCLCLAYSVWQINVAYVHDFQIWHFLGLGSSDSAARIFSSEGSFCLLVNIALILYITEQHVRHRKHDGLAIDQPDHQRINHK